MNDDPEFIGRYQIQSALGRGAMGAIYKAHDPDIDRPVAVKLIRADLLASAERDEYITRFRREAQAAARCVHPGIVAIYDFALHQGNPYLAMEYIDGATLAQSRPVERRFTPEDAIFVMLQVLEALQAAHDAGVVHRDVKPANIMLLKGTRVKVADFGIARLDASDLTHHEAVIGTPSYMSPEQCRGAVVDSRSDLFSAGVVLFEMLSGQKPFAGASAAETISKVMLAPAPPLADLVPGLDQALCAVVMRSLAKSPDERHATAADMAHALKAAAALSGTHYDDRTIIVPPRPPSADARPTASSATLATRLDPLLVSTLSRKLAELVGPIAPYLLQTALRKATSVEALCSELERTVEKPEARQMLQQEVRRQLQRLGGTAGGSTEPGPVAAAVAEPGPTTETALALAPESLAQLQHALTRQVGPMARLMIKRALPGAASLQVLKERLADQIADAQARAAFLREC